MKPQITVENREKVGFKVQVEEFEQFAIISIVFDRRYEHYATHYGVCAGSDNDVTLGIFPDNYNDLPLDEQAKWDNEMPTVSVKFTRKYSYWVFSADDKETYSFIVVDDNLFMGERKCYSEI